MDHGGNFVAQNVRFTSLGGRARVLSASIALSLLVLNSASAATDIQGTLDDIRLKVDNATLAEVLNALSSRFKVTYKLRSHNPRLLTGQYSGTLRETLTRILDGNDYFLELSDKGLEIIVLRASEPQSATPRQVASTAPAPTSPSSAAPPPVRAAPTPPVTTSGPVSPSNPAPSTSSVPPLSSFAVLPPVAP